MSEDISKRPDFLIVSDTSVYVNEAGEYLAFEPVAREIEHFSHLFNSITWIAAKYEYDRTIRNVKRIEKIPIRYILTPAIGGRGFCNRLRIIREYFRLAFIILINIYKADVIHSRGPSHSAIITVFYSLFFRNKIYWHKYAGNWIRKDDPLSYSINKLLLKKAKGTIVTINGCWPDQPDHVISYENPCLTEQERNEGREILMSKDFSGALDFAFIGQLTESKGVGRIIEAFKILSKEPRIGFLHIAGDGADRSRYETLALEAGIRCKFYGFLPKDEVNKILIKSHVLLLPSESEGFPKVVAEGSNYGCIPVVSDVSCLDQYIENNINGFILPALDVYGLVLSIKEILNRKGEDLKNIAANSIKMSDMFTYDRYINRIKEEILNKKIKTRQNFNNA
jgi:glycosyltransferase involved in cell wall biosynthesis